MQLRAFSFSFGVLAAVALPALAHAKPGAPPKVAVTAPVSNAKVGLDAGLDVRFPEAKGADQIECTVKQGDVTWSEKVGGISTGCGPDKLTIAKKFKAGKATLTVRTRLGAAWSEPTTVPVDFVKDAPKSDAAAVPIKGKDGQYSWPDATKRGTSSPATWDASYEASATAGKSITCPSAGEDDAKIEVKGGQVAFTVVLGPKGTATKKRGQDPRSHVAVKATVGADQTLSGKSTLSADNLAFLAEGDHADGFPKGVVTLAVLGKAENVNAREGGGDLIQGRVLVLSVTPSSGNVAGCTVTARAADTFHASAASLDAHASAQKPPPRSSAR